MALALLRRRRWENYALFAGDLVCGCEGDEYGMLAFGDVASCLRVAAAEYLGLMGW